MSHTHAGLSFSDEEVMSLYLFGIMDKNRELKQIYNYADRHLRGWFPQLPSYVAFVQRLNKVADVFAPLLIDSFPVALAKQGHRFKACVV